MGEGRTPKGKGGGGVEVGLVQVIGVVSGVVALGIVVPALVGGGAPRVGRMEIFFLRNDMLLSKL